MKKLLLLLTVIGILMPSLGFGQTMGYPYITFQEQAAAPPTPGTGYKFYFKSGGAYYVNSSGVEAAVGSSGGSSGVSGKVCKTVTNPSASDTHLLFDIGAARTITKVACICYGGTSAQATLYNAGADGSGSTAIHSAVTCDTNGANTTTISSATVTDGDIIYMAVGTVIGVVTQVMVCYE